MKTIKKICLLVLMLIITVSVIKYTVVSNATEIEEQIISEEAIDVENNMTSEILPNMQEDTQGILEENSANLENAYGNELVSISENVSAITNVETEYVVTTTTTTNQIVNLINTFLNDNVNRPESVYNYYTGVDIEDWLESNIYILPNIASLKYGKTLNPYDEDAILEFPHNVSKTKNMNEYVVFSNSTWYKHSPKLRGNPTIFKEVYDNYDQADNSDIKTQVAYSNYNAKRIYPYWEVGSIIGTNDLKDLNNHYDTQYVDAHRIPYILAFLEKGSENFMTSPSAAQKALWGATGAGQYQYGDLYKASKAVEYFLNVEKEDHPTSLEIKLPSGAQVGTVYSVTTADLDAMYEAIGGAGFIGEAQPEITFDKTAKVKVGPFVMGDYAYAISEYVEDFSGTDKDSKAKLEWPSIIAGIVGGEITLDDGTTIDIGTSSGSTAKICYTDWYNNVPYDYVAQEFGKSVGDVRGELRGSNNHFVSVPKKEGTYSSANKWDKTGAITKTSMGGAPAQIFDLKVTINEGGEQVDYPFPLPYSTFYIEIPVSACKHGNVLSSISFDYRTTEVTGEGDVIIVRAAKTTTSFSQEKTYSFIEGIFGIEETIEEPCTNYTHSEGCYCGGGHYSETCHKCNCDDYCILDCSSDHHTSSCYTQKTCNDTDPNHKHTNACTGKELTCTTSHAHTKPDCYKCCTCDGHYWTYSGVDCDGTCKCDGHSETVYCERNGTWAKCEHGHRDCTEGYNEVELGPDGNDVTHGGTVYGQPLVRIDEAKVKVGTYKYTKSVNVRLFSVINRSAKIVFVWHGWDEGVTYEGNENMSGFFDFTDFSYTDPKPAEVGDRVTYKVSYENKTEDDYFAYVRANYPANITANSLTDIKVKTADLFDKGSALINKFFNLDLLNTTFIKPDANNMQQIVNTGYSRTGSAKVLLKGRDTLNFFVQFIFTTDWKMNPDTNEYYSLVADITSRDGKAKSTTYGSLATTNFAKRPDLSNIDFVRTKYSSGDPRHLGPVMTKVNWIPDTPKHKEYTVDINKYIYDVNHADGSTLYTFNASEERGINHDDSITNNTLNYDGVKAKHDAQEPLKQQNPVYVEYGDRVTYKIELSNTKIIDREEHPYYEPDKVYVTLVDELPLKYSELKYTIESIGEEGAEEQKEHLQVSTPPDKSTSGTRQKFTFKDIMIPKNGTTIITISLVVEEHTKGTVEQNRAYIDTNEGVYNFNRGDLRERQALEVCTITKHTKITGDSSDWYKLNDYKVDIDKYISSYRSKIHDENEAAGLTVETPIIGKAGLSTFFEDRKMVPGTTLAANEDTRRKGMSNTDKSNNPVQVEKTDDIIYTIKLQNLTQEAKKSFVGGTKNKTAVRVSKVIEEIHQGLDIKEVKAYIYYNSGIRKRDITQYLKVTPNISDGETKYEFTLDHVYNTLLMQNEFVVFYVRAKVSESNMSLEKLTNTATLAVLTNINTPDTTDANSSSEDARVIKEEKTGGYNENTITNSSSTEYARTKDLVISGKVWLDMDRNGQMNGDDTNTTILSNKDKELYLKNSNAPGKAGVVVKLYKASDTTKPLRTTVTDANGLYTFSKKSDGSWYQNSFDSSGNTSVSKDGKTYQRVDKAEKDTYGNYATSKKYIEYYIEFEYDGILYKSTEVYSTGKYPPVEDSGMKNLTGNGNFNDLYRTDSNAFEKKSERERFNNLYEYISYNSAFDINESNPQKLEFTKEGHISLLKEDKTRVVRARSFINNKTDKDNYLWLYKGDGVGGPETEYLKYINLGLELREEVDISLTKDVYKVKTTINGESMEYDFNQNNALNGATTGLGGSQRPVNEYLQDFIIKKPYGLELYEFDYKFRVDQYFSEEVRNYKGSESELNVEVTYRITIDNKPLSDADDVKGIGKTVTETPLNVKVNEIMDLYEDNFIKLGEKTNNEIPVKIKDVDGTLKDTQIKTIEAWYFKQDDAGTYIIENPTEVANGVKPLYKEDPTSSETKYAKVNLTIDAHSADSEFNDNDINYEDYGYNKLFIRGMGDIAIGENQSLDIYVKYVLDKGEEQFELSSASIDSYEETTKDGVTKYNSATLGDAYGSYTYTIERQGTTNKFTIQRSLKIKDPVTTNERTNNRGVENIAQINAYSVWYTDGSPASLVDRNSNVGNIGTDGSSPDDYTQYDDTAYKTGIVISVEDTAMDKDDGSEISKFGVLEITGTSPLERVITGTVWDDARSVEVSEKYSAGPGAPQQLTNKQYLGNGEYSDDATDVNNRKVASAIANQNVEINYKRDDGSSVTEDHDFPIRNVKAEFIEIVKMEDPDVPGEYRYYEQLLQQVTWNQTQWDRTDDNGYYKLEGLIPGTYIIRFTYGDNVNQDGTFDETSKAQQDMLIFNGHDYKSTQFNPELEKIQGKNEDKIMEILEGNGISDAIDDEVRRLEVNSYSEVMTNPKAEILKGLGNGASKNGKSITTRTDASTKEELEDLIENTTMQAETVEFLVKPEKLTTDQINKRKESLVNILNPDYLLYSKLEAVQALERNNREFTIAHIDFGLEYRPENEIRLVKEIEEVKLITEDGETLVDLYFYTDGKGTATTHKVDKNKSKGVELVQFVSNAYNVLLKDLTNEDKQGFVFVQVDEEILQGCTVQIVYKFEAENNSEIDRITVNLDEIRYKENPEAQKLINAYPTAKVVADNDYTASGIAAEVVKADMYKTDAKGVEYRNKQKMLLDKETANLPADQQWEKEKQAYYGRYVGYTYYTGDITKLDTVASLKFDKILDYVDVNIEYIQKSEQLNTEDRFWIRSKSKDLENHIYQLRKNLVELLENGRGYTYEENLVLSVDDRIKDDTYSTRYSNFKITGVDDNIRNNDLARFLLPKGTVLNESERDKSVATIRLNVSKVLSAEADKKDMSYENMAEIIQFTTLTGRRTDFGTTIGNADIEAIAKNGGDEGKGSLEFVTAALESDTAATETITLIPPTGLMRNRRAIVNVVQATSVGVGFVFILGTIAVILIMIITIVLFVIRKYKKRRII